MDKTFFKEHTEGFLRYIATEKNLSENTVRAYKGDLDQFIAFWDGLPEQDKEHLGARQIIERYLVSLFYKKIDKSTVARKFSCFKSFERYAQRYAQVSLDLTFKRPRLDKKLPLYLSVDEMLHLLDKVDDAQLPTAMPMRDKTILEVLYATGVRCSELVGIRLSDIDKEAKTIRIYGKGRRERIVLFGGKALEKIDRYVEQERPRGINPSDYLFLNRNGQPLTSRSVQRIVAMFRPFIHLERPITPHKIRHSFATHLLNQGADLRVVQELLGHQSLASTEKYTHISLDDLARMCDTLHPIHGLMSKERK